MAAGSVRPVSTNHDHEGDKMVSFRPNPYRAVAVLLGLLMGVAPPRAAAQVPAAPPSPSRSVFGKLESVDKRLNGLIMVSDDGKRLAWRFEPAVIAEAARFKPGDPMVVIYRETASNEKRVTALAFPGSAATPIYLNLTGSRVSVHAAPMVNGACGPDVISAHDVTIPARGVAEVLEACWCCASAGATCTPRNRSGLGRALLVQCFE